jgi:hypothetical protein
MVGRRRIVADVQEVLTLVPLLQSLVDCRGGASVLAVLPQLTLWRTKNKKSSVLLSWLSGTPYTGTQQNRSDKMYRQPGSSQPGVVSQLVEAYARHERVAGWRWLTMHFILSFLLCYSVWSTTEPRNEDRRLLFFVFQSASRANRFNMNAVPCGFCPTSKIHVHVK